MSPLKITFLSILLFISLAGTAQLGLDSLKGILGSASDPYMKIETALTISDRIVYQNPSKALYYAKMALSISDSIAAPTERIKSLNRIGGAYWSMGNLQKAMDFHNLSLEEARAINDQGQIARNQGSIGTIYFSAEEKVIAIKYYKEALEYFEEIKNEDRLLAMYNNIGKAFLDLSEPDSAKFYLEKALTLANEQFPHLRPIVLFNFGEVAFKEGNIERSKQLLTECLELSNSIGDIRGMTRSYQLLAEIYNIENIQDSAFLYSSLAKDISLKTGVKELIYITHTTHSNILARKGLYEDAFEYRLISERYRDSVQSELIKNKLRLYEYEQNQDRIKLLEAQSELNAEISQKQKAYIIALLVILILVITILIVFILGRRKIIKNNRELEEKNIKIERQANQLEELNELKNKIIGIISHDIKGPVIDLFSMVELLRNHLVEPEELQKILPDITDKVRRTNQMIQNLIIWAKSIIGGDVIRLQPVSISDTIKEEISFFKSQIKNKKLDLDLNISDIQFDSDKTLLSLVIRNVLSNAIKYSNENGQIHISSVQFNGHLKIMVEDEGIGMSKEQLDKLLKEAADSSPGTDGEKGSGIGLLLIRDILKLINGKLAIESKPKEGTRVTLEIQSEH